MKKILIISYSPIASDPRVLRQISVLKDNYSVTVCGMGRDPEIEGITYSPVSLRRRGLLKRIQFGISLILRRYNSVYWSYNYIMDTYNMFKSEKFDLIIANDIEALPIASKLIDFKHIIFDAHEYYLGQFGKRLKERILKKPYIKYLCKKHIPNVEQMITVCHGLGKLYAEKYGVTCKILTNAPNYYDLKPSSIDSGQIKLVHHGVAFKKRYIELMIDMMELLGDRYTLDFYLMSPDKEYYNLLLERAIDISNVRFNDPVPTTEIPNVINQYDLGLFLLKPLNVNYEFALPNKFFEFIQARLGIAIGPSKEMMSYVKKYDLGVVSDLFTPESLAEKIKKLSKEDIEKFKLNSALTATELNFNNSSKILLDIVKGSIDE